MPASPVWEGVALATALALERCHGLPSDGAVDSSFVDASRNKYLLVTFALKLLVVRGQF